MATLKAGTAQALDMRLPPPTFLGTVTVATPTQIEVVSGPRKGDYIGQGLSFTATGGITGGTLTGYGSSFNDQPLFSVTGLSLPAVNVALLVQSGNVAQLEVSALSGDDTLYGAGNKDVLEGFGGNNTFLGVASGVDSVAYNTTSNGYAIAPNAGGFKVTRPDGGIDQLKDIKSIIFTDKTVDLTATSGIGSGSATDSPVISATTIGLYRFFSKTDGTHFYTSSTSEKNQIAGSRPDLTFEGIGLTAVNPANLANDPAAAPVYRFFDTIHGTHFYTTSQTEQQAIIAGRPDLKSEGTAFYADTTKQAGDAAVYRFFDKVDGTHFYTSSTTEAQQIAATRPDLKAEGIGFYVPTA